MEIVGKGSVNDFEQKFVFKVLSIINIPLKINYFGSFLICLFLFALPRNVNVNSSFEVESTSCKQKNKNKNKINAHLRFRLHIRSLI